MLFRWGAGATFPCAAAGEGQEQLLLLWPQGQLSHLSQVAMDKWRRAQFPHPCHHIPYKSVVTHYPMFPPSDPARSCPYEHGQLSCAAQVRCRTLSPECFRQWGAGPDLPSIAVREGQDKLCIALSSRPSAVSEATEETATTSEPWTQTCVAAAAQAQAAPWPWVAISHPSQPTPHLFWSFVFSDMTLSTGHEPFCLSLCRTTPHICSLQ